MECNIIYRHQAIPPLTRIFCPLTHRASPDARNPTTSAISSGSPIRLWGFVLAIILMTCSLLPFINNSVAVGPGDTTLTFIPCFPRSFARTLPICSMAPLGAGYNRYEGETVDAALIVVEKNMPLEPELICFAAC